MRRGIDRKIDRQEEGFWYSLFMVDWGWDSRKPIRRWDVSPPSAAELLEESPAGLMRIVGPTILR